MNSCFDLTQFIVKVFTTCEVFRVQIPEFFVFHDTSSTIIFRICFKHKHFIIYEEKFRD